MMKVLLVIDYFPPDKLGGAGEAVYNLQKHLQKRGIETIVITSGKRNDADVNVIRICRSVKLSFLLSFLLLPFLIKKIRPDVINFHQASNAFIALPKLLYPKSFPAVVATLQVSNKQVAQEIHPVFHNSKLLAKPNVYEYIEKYIFALIHIIADRLSTKMSDMVTAVSEQTRKECIRDYKVLPHKIKVVHNGIDIERFTAYPSNNEIRKQFHLGDCPIVLYVGVFCIRKRLHNLLYAMRMVVEEVPDAKLLIVGGGRGYEGELGRLVDELNLENVVLFAGKVPNEQLPKYYACADVVALPSSYEGLPIVILEAMAMGKAVVASNVSGNPDAIRDGVTGFLIEKDNIRQFAEKIIFLLLNEDVRQQIGKAARKRIEESFSWDKIAQEYETLYRSIIADKTVILSEKANEGI